MHSGMVLLSKYWILALSFLLFCFFSFAGATDLTAQTEGVEKIFIQRGFEQIAVIRVATVSDRKAMEKGLSGKPPIPDDFGMLFIIDSSREHFFWMKNSRADKSRGTKKRLRPLFGLTRRVRS